MLISIFFLFHLKDLDNFRILMSFKLRPFSDVFVRYHNEWACDFGYIGRLCEGFSL
jgi:hypothetical protein